MIIQGYIRLMICIGATAFQMQWVSTYTHTNTLVCISYPKSHLRDVWLVCACVCFALYCMCTHPPKKTSKQEKRKNMQQKYLRLEACSLKIHRVFLWADLGLRKKGGKKRKEKIQKRLLAKTEKKNIKKRKEERAKRTNQQRVHGCLLFCSFFFFFFSLKRVQKQKQKASQTQIYHKKRHKIKENRFLDVISFSPPAEENGCHCLWSPHSLSSWNPCLFPEPVLCFLGAEWAGLVKKGKSECGSNKASVVWRTGPRPFLPPYDQKKRQT